MLAVQVIFLSVLACGHARVATHQESFDQDRPDQFRQDALHLAPAVIHQPRGLIWDWLVGRSKGGTTPRPVRRPGDRQDESPTADLTGSWIPGKETAFSSRPSQWLSPRCQRFPASLVACC